MYQYKDYNRIQLRSLIDNEDYWKRTYIPITKAKIIHQINNPNVEDDDILLFTIETENKIISYLGTIPNIIQVNGEVQKIFWLSTWWIHPECSEKAKAAYLFFYAWEKLNGKIGISSYSNAAGQFYKRFNQFVSIPKMRYIFFFNFDVTLFNSNYPHFRILGHTIDFLLSPLFLLYRIQLKKIMSKLQRFDVKLEYISAIDQESCDFISKVSNNDLVPKSYEYLNWKFVNQSHLITPLYQLMWHKLDFSGYAVKRFCRIAYKVFFERQLVAISLIEVFNNRATVLFNFYTSNNLKFSVDVLLWHVLKFNCDSLFCEDSDIEKEINSRKNAALYTHKIQKDAIISKKIVSDKNYVEHLKLHYGDGG